MFKKLFSPTTIQSEDMIFFQKLSCYFIANCKAVYGEEYIPRLAQRICRTKGIDLECHKGFLKLSDGGYSYNIPYCFNVYKSNIVDFNLFMIKKIYKKREQDKDNNNIFRDVDIFDYLPSFIISINKELLPKQIVGYESKKMILNKDFQPSEILDNDNLILAVYNDCYASSIAFNVTNVNLDEIVNMEPSVNFYTWTTMQGPEIKKD